MQIYSLMTVIYGCLATYAIIVDCNFLTNDLITKRIDRELVKQLGKCGDIEWMKNYTLFHNSNLGKDNKINYLVAIPNLSGLADRVIGFTTVFLFSMLTNRLFQIGDRNELTLISTAFISNSINWSRPQDQDWIIEPLKHKASQRNYNNSILDTHSYYAVNTIDDWKLQDRFLRQDLNSIFPIDYKTIFISINRGKTIRIFENSNYRIILEKYGLNPYNAFGCIVNYLIKPRVEIFHPIIDQFLKITDPNPKILKIGIQIRVGDWQFNKADQSINLNHFRSFFECAQQIENFAMKPSNDGTSNYTSSLWYFLSDSKQLRIAAKHKYGDKIITNTDIITEHSAKESSVCSIEGNNNCTVSLTGYTTAAAEWYTLGFADYFVITLYSGYGRSAGFRSLKRDHIYTIKNGNGDALCNEKSFTDLENLSFDWSGI
eukprot:gene17036-23418_t